MKRRITGIVLVTVFLLCTLGKDVCTIKQVILYRGVRDEKETKTTTVTIEDARRDRIGSSMDMIGILAVLTICMLLLIIRKPAVKKGKGEWTMEAITCLEGRRSVRNFTEEKVTHEVMERIVETARFAPSWKNTQTARFIMIENEAMLHQIAEEAVLGFEHNAEIIRNAAGLVVVTCVHGRAGFERDGSYSTAKEDRWEVFDAGIATQTFCLAAHANGVGSVILGIFDEEKIREIAAVEEGQVVCALVAVGYAAGENPAPKRKSVEQLLSYRG